MHLGCCQQQLFSIPNRLRSDVAKQTLMQQQLSFGAMCTVAKATCEIIGLQDCTMNRLEYGIYVFQKSHKSKLHALTLIVS